MPQQRKNFTVRLDPALIVRVKVHAVKQQVSMEDLVARALEDLLKREGERK